MRQLFELSRKFPKEWIKKAPKGKFGNYVPHPVITQRLLEVCGPFNWEVVELIRQESSGSVVGCFGKLTVEVDGKPVTVTSIGDVEHDQKNDGSNAKHAESAQQTQLKVPARPAPLRGCGEYPHPVAVLSLCTLSATW